MRKYMLLLCVAFTLACDSHHHYEDAHVHGVGTLNVAVDGARSVVLELRVPGMTLYGFEHKAKNDADRRKQEAALTLLKDKIHEMAVFDASLGCRFGDSDIELEQEHDHSEIHAQFAVECEEELSGGGLRFAFGRHFPGFEKLQVRLLSDARQDSVLVEHDKGELTF